MATGAVPEGVARGNAPKVFCAGAKPPSGAQSLSESRQRKVTTDVAQPPENGTTMVSLVLPDEPASLAEITH